MGIKYFRNLKVLILIGMFYWIFLFESLKVTSLDDARLFKRKIPRKASNILMTAKNCQRAKLLNTKIFCLAQVFITMAQKPLNFTKDLQQSELHKSFHFIEQTFSSNSMQFYFLLHSTSRCILIDSNHVTTCDNH